MAKIDAPSSRRSVALPGQKVEPAQEGRRPPQRHGQSRPAAIQAAANTKIEAIRVTADGEPSKLIDSATLDAIQKIKDYCPA